jgi:hypothetical protein
MKVSALLDCKEIYAEIDFTFQQEFLAGASHFE